MKNSNTIKALTLFIFCILIIGFLAFKSGAFDKYLKKESNISTMPDNEKVKNGQAISVDTLPAKKTDTTRPNPKMLSTSKSVILIDQEIRFPILDSLKKKSAKPAPKN